MYGNMWILLAHYAISEISNYDKSKQIIEIKLIKNFNKSFSKVLFFILFKKEVMYWTWLEQM